MKFMVNVEGADIAIVSGYSDASVLTTEAPYHFWLDTNVFIYRLYQCRDGDMRYRRSWH